MRDEHGFDADDGQKELLTKVAGLLVRLKELPAIDADIVKVIEPLADAFKNFDGTKAKVKAAQLVDDAVAKVEESLRRRRMNRGEAMTPFASGTRKRFVERESSSSSSARFDATQDEPRWAPPPPAYAPD